MPPKRRNSLKSFFLTLPVDALPEGINIGKDDDRTIPENWNVPVGLNVTDNLKYLVTETGVSAWKMLQSFEDLMERFSSMAKIRSLCPQFRKSVPDGMIEQPRTVFIDFATFESYAANFRTELRSVENYFTVFRRQITSIKDMLEKSVHDSTTESLSSTLAEWWSKREAEAEVWYKLLEWMKERITVKGTLEQLAEMVREYGKLTVYRAPDGNRPLYTLHQGKALPVYYGSTST